jgi:hypothetical protein
MTVNDPYRHHIFGMGALLLAVMHLLDLTIVGIEPDVG